MAVPGPVAVTTPDDTSTVAIAVLLLENIPPVTDAVTAVVLPTHNVGVPVHRITEGTTFLNLLLILSLIYMFPALSIVTE